MTKRSTTAIEIVSGAVAIGILADLLLRATPWGLNVTAFVLAFVALMTLLTYRNRRQILDRPAIELSAAMVIFAAMFAIRDSEELLVIDSLAILAIMGVLILRGLRIEIARAGMLHYIGGLFWAGFNSLFAPLLLIGKDLDRRLLPGNRIASSIFAVSRGLAIALPLLLVFGVLFSAADARFESFIQNLVDFNLRQTFSHIAIASVFALLTAGYLRGTLIEPFVSKSDSGDETDRAAVRNESPEEGDFPQTPQRVSAATGQTRNSRFALLEKLKNFDNSLLPQSFTLGTIETILIFGLVDLIFLAFVVFQLPYLFGGMELVQSTPGLKLADFARRGFGELVVASLLVLPMLLVGHWLLRRGQPWLNNVFRVLALVQIALLGVVIASALQRVMLLTSEVGYGWTPARFYPIFLMLWLSVVFLWFIATVLFGNRENFAWGALRSAILILFAVNLLNPDEFIVNKNLDLMRRGRQFDVSQATSLGDDAVPQLIKALPEMNGAERCIVQWELHKKLTREQDESDLRTWNLARRNAKNLLRTEHENLHPAPDNSCPTWMDFVEE